MTFGSKIRSQVVSSHVTSDHEAGYLPLEDFKKNGEPRMLSVVVLDDNYGADGYEDCDSIPNNSMSDGPQKSSDNVLKKTNRDNTKEASNLGFK